MMDLSNLGLYTRTHQSIEKYFEKRKRYLKALDFFGNGITTNTSDEEIESIYKKRLEDTNDEIKFEIDSYYDDIKIFREDYPNTIEEYLIAETTIISFDSFIEPRDFVKDKRFSPTFEILYFRILNIVGVCYQMLLDKEIYCEYCINTPRYIMIVNNVIWEKIVNEIEEFLKKLKINDISLENIRSENISWLFEKLMEKYPEITLEQNDEIEYCEQDYILVIETLTKVYNRLLDFFGLEDNVGLDEIDNAYQTKINAATTPEEEEAIKRNYDALITQHIYFSRRQTKREKLEEEINKMLSFPRHLNISPTIKSKLSKLSELRPPYYLQQYHNRRNKLSLLQIEIAAKKTKETIGTELGKIIEEFIDDDEKNEKTSINVESFTDFYDYFEKKRELFIGKLRIFLEEKLKTVKESADTKFQQMIQNDTDNRFKSTLLEEPVLNIIGNEEMIANNYIPYIISQEEKYKKIKERYAELCSIINMSDIPSLKSRFANIEQEWEKLEIKDLDQFSQKVEELIKDIKRREYYTPATTDNLDYEIYVRKFESCPPREKKVFFVLDRQQMIMYTPSIIRTEPYPISEEDLNQNFISLSEVLVNCKTLNERASIPEIDFGFAHRIIHYWDNKYVIYADSLGYQIIIGPLGEMKKNNSSMEEIEWQMDCTIGGCIDAIRKQCLQKLEITDTLKKR